MKILFVSAYFDDHGGGIEKVVKVSSEALAECYDVNVSWAAWTDADVKSDCHLVKKVSLSGTNFCESKLGFPYPIIGLNSLKKLYRAIKSSDLVHIHDYIYMSSLASWLFAKMLKKPIFITQHIGVVKYKNFLLRNLHQIMNVYVGRFVLRRVEEVIFISSSVKSYFCGGGAAEKHWSYIPNGVDTTLFNPGNGSFLSKKAGVLFVGRFVEKKGLDFLRGVAQLSPHISYSFIGEGPLNPGSWGLANVKVLGCVWDEKELANHYRNARIFVLPSYGEGFPLVVQEALACGVKIFISEDVKSGCDSLPDDVVALDIWKNCAEKQWAERIKDEMEAELSQEEQVARLKHIGAFVHQNWSWSSVIKKHRDAYMIHVTRSL